MHSLRLVRQDSDGTTTFIAVISGSNLFKLKRLPLGHYHGTWLTCCLHTPLRFISCLKSLILEKDCWYVNSVAKHIHTSHHQCSIQSSAPRFIAAPCYGNKSHPFILPCDWLEYSPCFWLAEIDLYGFYGSSHFLFSSVSVFLCFLQQSEMQNRFFCKHSEWAASRPRGDSCRIGLDSNSAP